MKPIREIVENYELQPAIHNLSDDINTTFNRLIITIKDNCITPDSILVTYRRVLEVYNTTFKTIILNNANSKSGMFIKQSNYHNLDEYISKTYKFTVSKSNMRLGYTKNKLYDIAKYEIGLILGKYNKIYDFQIQYIILYLLLNKFELVYTDFANKRSWALNFADIEDVYNGLLNCQVNDLPNISEEELSTIAKKQFESDLKKKQTSLLKPQCAEDLTCLFDEGMSQNEKCIAIMANWPKCGSIATAKRWMKKFDLLNKSTMEIHFENAKEERKEILRETKNSITLSKWYFTEIMSKLDKLIEQNEELKEQNKQLLKENKELKERLNVLEKNQQNIMNTTSKVEDLLGDTTFLNNNFKLK